MMQFTEYQLINLFNTIYLEYPLADGFNLSYPLIPYIWQATAPGGDFVADIVNDLAVLRTNQPDLKICCRGLGNIPEQSTRLSVLLILNPNESTLNLLTAGAPPMICTYSKLTSIIP